MKTRNILKILGTIAASILMLSFTACNNPTDNGGSSETGIIDTPITSFTGTVWADNLLPESRITFTSNNQLELEGRYWKKYLELASTTLIDLSGVHSYECANDLQADAVEPAVWVLMDVQKRTGFEMYLYKANAGMGKHLRLVVYRDRLLQPREFYRIK